MILELLAAGLVGLAGAFLLGLGVMGLVAPVVVSRFLLAFAGSQAKHYLELISRILLGGAFILHAPRAGLPAVILGVGWILVGTTVVLALIPWRWHQVFAQRSVPQALRHLPWLSLASLLFGLAVLHAAFGNVVR